MTATSNSNNFTAASGQFDVLVNAAGTGAPSATFGLILADGSAEDGADANTVLTVASKDAQVFNISASRTVTLPTTSVKKGREFTLINRGAFDLVVNASGGSALTIANSANIDATVRQGYVVVRALQDTPTSPAHWYVVAIAERAYDLGTVTYTHPDGAVTGNINFHRNGKQILARVQDSSASVTVVTIGQNFTTSAGVVPARFRPDAAQFLISLGRAGGVATTISYSVSTAGTINLSNLAGGGFAAGSAGLGQASNYQTFSWAST